ncbi:hypothetical protein JXB02_06070 [Candidatus Woesearchaeota archaeon]|nr:hypothetical protein [Candidatus Woesearchaeota archaeon]
MILTIDALLDAEERGDIVIEGRDGYNLFSLDLHLEKLYRHKDRCPKAVGDGADHSDAEYIASELEEVEIPAWGMIIEPDDFFLWQPRERMTLAGGYHGAITSRSGWARLGVRVHDTSEELRPSEERRSFTPLCALKAGGTRVFIRRGDSMAQLYLERGIGHVPNWRLRMMILDGTFTVTRKGIIPPLSYFEHPGGMQLTMGPQVHIYNPDRILVPGVPHIDDFRAVSIETPVRLGRGTFFLSASAEYVEIPEGHCGYVSQGGSVMSLQKYMRTGDPRFAPQPFLSHADAPYIGPKNIFHGNITFENLLLDDYTLVAGMRQSEFFLVPLLGDGKKYRGESSYIGQTGAALSRL